MEKLYKEYFQKSKVFLYPLLGLKKGVRFVPLQTYISWNDVYKVNDNKLLCLYAFNEENKEDFILFSKDELENLHVYEKKHDIDDYNFLYVFDLSLPVKKRDLKNFKKGKYSSFSKSTRERIMKFFGEKGKISEYIESYLYPDYYWEDYAELLKIDQKNLEDVGELCNKPDLQKEDFAFDCELIKKSLYLKIKN